MSGVLGLKIKMAFEKKEVLKLVQRRLHPRLFERCEKGAEINRLIGISEVRVFLLLHLRSRLLRVSWQGSARREAGRES